MGYPFDSAPRDGARGRQDRRPRLQSRTTSGSGPAIGEACGTSIGHSHTRLGDHEHVYSSCFP